MFNWFQKKKEEVKVRRCKNNVNEELNNILSKLNDTSYIINIETDFYKNRKNFINVRKEYGEKKDKLSLEFYDNKKNNIDKKEINIKKYTDMLNSNIISNYEYISETDKIEKDYDTSYCENENIYQDMLINNRKEEKNIINKNNRIIYADLSKIYFKKFLYDNPLFLDNIRFTEETLYELIIKNKIYFE